jgi:IclR family transcriptional regulator, acetate operon repressor
VASQREYTVASVARALRILDVVAAGPEEGISLSEVARVLTVSKSTAYALIQTLVANGHLRAVEPGPRYLPGAALMRLGDLAAQRFALGSVCRPILHDLGRVTGLTIRAAINDRRRPLFIERVDAPGAIRFHTPLGAPELPHTSSAGKAILAMLRDDEVRRVVSEVGLPRRTEKTITTVDELLADLQLTRRRGYAVDDEEDVAGVFCVGAAFTDHSGRCAGAVSATGIKRDLPARRVEELGHLVRGAADRVSLELGGRPWALVAR